MATADLASTTSRVRRQYEALPYPHRDPAEEAQRLLLTEHDDLRQINCYCFGGRRNFAKGFRALVAGGGTGDATVYLAEQLRSTNGKVYHLDLSTASLDVAKERISRRGLQNKVTWIQDSLLNLSRLGLPPFDYINCSGVLHHLEDPSAGLQTLAAALKPDGALGIMVYGKYGRTGVYQMQDLMRLVNHGTSEPAQMLDLTRRTLSTLPDTNWFQRGSELFLQKDTGDTEVYDLFLHSQDRAYSIPELFQWLDQAGLQLAEFSPKFRLFYQPRLAFTDPEVLRQVESLTRPQQYAACEIMWGNIKKHSFWATRKGDHPGQVFDEHAVPIYSQLAINSDLAKTLLASREPIGRIDVEYSKGLTLTISVDMNDISRAFLRFVDGRRTMKEIVALIAAKVARKTNPADIFRVCRGTFETLLSYDFLLMQHKSLVQ